MKKRKMSGALPVSADTTVLNQAIRVALETNSIPAGHKGVEHAIIFCMKCSQTFLLGHVNDVVNMLPALDGLIID
jgi:hypothetical protein